jgi:chlorite dismutase
MMNEHIRVGHQYPEIKQLLLYSFGVQDQEFVVVYETENLYQFSELVNELRGSDVREYTERDTPVYTGIWRSPEALAELVGAKG